MWSNDTIDVRDLTDRVDELEAARDGYDTCGLCQGADGPIVTFAKPEPPLCPDCGGAGKMGAFDWAQSEEAGELAELTAALEELAGDGGDHEWRGDWYPGTLIADHYFEDYARELAADIGAVNEEIGWPMAHIDWSAAAAALQQDYSCVELGGVTWRYR
jgi:hypothetical protein